MNPIHSLKLCAVALVGVLFSIPVGKLVAQTDVNMWLYSDAGNGVAYLWQTTHPRISDAHYLEIGGTNTSDDQLMRWEKLLQTGYIYGDSSNLVRGRDMVEDWDINWGTPAIENTANSSRWVAIEGSYTSATWVWKGTNNVGPHPNQLFRGNPNLLAVGDDHALFWDSDNTLSYYYLGGSLTADYTWTTLTGGGLLDQQTLSLSLMSNHFIGYEEGVLGFLVGEDRVDFYYLATGSFFHTTDYSQVNAGPLAGDVTLAGIIDGLYPQYTYMGLDSVLPGVIISNIPQIIPEPSTSLLLVGTGLFILMRRRRK